MADAVIISCPKCSAPLGSPLTEPLATCACGWAGDVSLFDPIPGPVHEAEQALPDDAVCTEHPAKRAISVCAGSGDYICALCSIELQGEVYSAKYLEAGGKQKIAAAFDRTLARPDRMASGLLACSVLLYIVAPVTLPMAWYYYVKAMRRRRTEPMLRELMSTTRVVLLSIGLGLYTLLIVLGVGALILSLLFK